MRRECRAKLAEAPAAIQQERRKQLALAQEEAEAEAAELRARANAEAEKLAGSLKSSTDTIVKELFDRVVPSVQNQSKARKKA